MNSERREATASGYEEENDHVWTDAAAATWKLPSAYADFISDYHITHFVTLTLGDYAPSTKIQEVHDGFRISPPRAQFGDQVSVERAERQFFRFKRDLERRSGARVGYAMVVEQTYLGRAHIHAVLSVHGLSTKEIARAWQRGRCQVEEYDPTRGGLPYMFKTIDKVQSWDLDGLVRKDRAA